MYNWSILDYVTSGADYFLTESYANKVYNAVKDVSGLLCMKFSGKCSRDELYSYLGDNRFTALKVTIHLFYFALYSFTPKQSNNYTVQ